MNLLLRNTSETAYLTDMRAVFDALPGVCEAHDWLVSNLECSWLTSDDEDGVPDARFNSSSLLITGDELWSVLRQRDIQFNWAVFSALPKGSEPPAGEELPYADGNRDLWAGSPTPQLSIAAFEIVCWDSTQTLLIGVNSEMAESFRAVFPNVLDLDAYNLHTKRLL
jgi:hypothetical protein